MFQVYGVWSLQRLLSLRCTYCERYHPSILHLEPRRNRENNPNTDETKNSCLTLATSSTAHKRAGNVRQAVVVVPIQLKHKDSDKHVETCFS